MQNLVWTLKQEAGRRFYSGHPWVFSNELKRLSKGLTTAAWVELRSERGDFLALGHGNPQSLIAFRTLSRDAQDLGRTPQEIVVRRLVGAWQLRHSLGLCEQSFRWCFAEVDGLPGLVVDRFALPGNRQVVVAQILSAGMDQTLKEPNGIFQAALAQIHGSESIWLQTALVVRRDSSARKLEGLEVAGVEVLKDLPNLDLVNTLIQVSSAAGQAPLDLHVDLVSGQKTGFFLDQGSNLRLAVNLMPTSLSGSVKVLDLFCYVGQWGAQLSAAIKVRGAQAHVDLVDASQEALRKAEANVHAAGGAGVAHRLDIMEGLSSLGGPYDWVICDPPAFIKSRKDHAAGLRGYVKANALALAKVRKGGYFVSCSCSHHLSDEDFVEVLSQAERKSGRVVKWVARGQQASDHPVLMGFPEGRYLKAWMGIVQI